jgi:hypothetical protein
MPGPDVPLDLSGASVADRWRLEEEIRGVLWPLLLIGLILCPGPVGAQNAPPEAFYGDWKGVALTSTEGTGKLELTAEDLNVRIEPADDGFRIYWTSLGHGDSDDQLIRKKAEARFAPTDRPGVFAFDPEDGSMLMGLFSDPSTSNPLEGEPLLWARIADQTLAVYGLMINGDGGFDLYHHVRTLTDDGMAAHQTHRSEREPMVIIEGQLKRAGD